MPVGANIIYLFRFNMLTPMLSRKDVPESFRVSRNMVQAGVDLPTVKRIRGHKTLAMVERYAHANGEHIQAAMNKLEHRYNNAKS